MLDMSLLPIFESSKKLLSLTVVLLLCTAFANAEEESKPDLKTKPGPPPGFEDLANPQTTAIDVYYGGKNIGSVLATYTPETVELESPSTVVSLIPRISNEIEVEAALSGPLAANADKVCLTEIQRDCGYLEPAVAGIIFDEGYFKLEVFINAYYLETKKLVDTKFLPESTTEFSTVNLFSTSLSGNDNNNTYAVSAQHIAAHKQSRLQLEWNHTDINALNIERLSFQHDKLAWSTEAGIFNSHTRYANFINETDLLGARVYTSTNTRTDLEYSQSTEILQFLSSPSLIEIFKDEVLVHAEEYEAGNQQIDTQILPGGSYPIRLRITDSRGEVREEELFFVKSGLLPPKDQPLYFAEFGKVSSNSRDGFPEYSDDYLARIGTAHRLHEKLGVDIEYLHGTDEGILQGGAVYLGSNFNLQAHLMTSSESATGLDVSGQFSRNNFNLNFNYRKVEAGDRERDFNEFQLVPSSFTQANVSANAQIAGGTLTLRGRQNKRANQESFRTYGFEYRKPLYRKNRYQIDLTTSSFIEDDDLSMWVGFSFNRYDGNKQFTSGARYVNQEMNGSTEQDLELDGQFTYSNTSPDYGDYSFSLFSNDNINQSAVGARARSQSSLGRADFLYEVVDNKSSGSFSRYFGNASFSMFTSGRDFAWGGKRSNTSGLIVALDTELTDAPFEVFVDRQPRGFARSGKSTVIGLQPYESYQVQVKPRGDDITHFEDKIQTVTLYPGNVETLRWEISPVIILISNAVYEDGSPVDYAKFENTLGFASTDDSGWFQIEIANREPLILSKKGTPVCQITLPNFTADQGVAVLDQVSCLPIDGQTEK